MKKHWFNRFLVSYLPIFIFINSVLVFIFFLVLSDQVRSQAVKANQAAAEQALQSVDYSLRSVHEMVMKEFRINEDLQQFFIETAAPSPIVHAKVSSLLSGMTLSNDLIHNIYLYRDYDRRVLTNKMMVDADEFAEKEFVQEAFTDKTAANWTNIREVLSEPAVTEPVKVVSLVRRYPILSGDSGVIVINVNASLLQKRVDEMTGGRKSFMELYDREGTRFFDKRLQFAGNAEAEGKGKGDPVLSTAVSDLTGWELRSGYKSIPFFSFASLVSNVWAWLAFGSILFGAAAIFYVSRRNYKPIELILERISASPALASDARPGEGRFDEFKRISTALDDLIEQSDHFKQRQYEDLAYRKQIFFEELLSGERPVSLDEWNKEMARFGLRSGFGSLMTAVAEIDRYSAFSDTYSHRDQLLLKYGLSAVIKEIAESESVTVASEWMSNRHLAVIFLIPGGASEQAARVPELCERAREWVKANLRMTVTFGIGDRVEEIGELSLSYEEAMQALKFKPVLGNDKIISAADCIPARRNGMDLILQTARALAQSFRLNEESWKEMYRRIFDILREGSFPRDDILHVMNYMNFCLEKEMMDLPADVQLVWRETAQPQLLAGSARFELLEDVELELQRVLSDAAGRFLAMRQQRHNHKLIQEIKLYLEQNYANPDLSLDHISEHFELSPKYFSRLFKEEFGEKFTEFLAKLRVQEAKRLLVETDEPVQTISVKVGYLHALSFIRMFKKITSITPGLFRSEHQNPGKSEK
ncbi:helix-turn-helix domain-containing protein [Paenibacillus sp. GCM10012303]|uniref:helix-turn-helix domain-containing protein n=1 Tax=Paenibacillus sp. GCM10012303 TaxID=3317340 RepID=UPI00360C41C3